MVPRIARSDERYTAKSFAEALPRAADFGERWQPVHPDRWLMVNSASVTAMYDRKANEPGKLDASVIADCFIYKNEAEAKKMLEAKRDQISAYPTAVIKDVTARDFLFHPLGSLPAEGPGSVGVRRVTRVPGSTESTASRG